MIPTNDDEIFESALSELQRFGAQTSARGRFIALYLGLRKMRKEGLLASLGSEGATRSIEIEEYLDKLFEKTNREPPLVILTAPFGQSRKSYSARSGETAPGNAYPTNTWRNNFGLQKGIGCPAASEVIEANLVRPEGRSSCPHIATLATGSLRCDLADTEYRGEKHSIWLRQADGGYQVVDLDLPEVYQAYLQPGGSKIPLFALIGVLYPFSPDGAYPARLTVGLPEFAADFDLDMATVEDIFDCDPDADSNAFALAAIGQRVWRGLRAKQPTGGPTTQGGETEREGEPLPERSPIVILNTGTEAEVLVGQALEASGWDVGYFGNQRGLGFDLKAVKADVTIHVEVKSSVGACTPELTDAEWQAAQRYGDSYILAVVSFLGSSGQDIAYVRDPAATATTMSIQSTSYRVRRQSVAALRVDVDSL